MYKTLLFSIICIFTQYSFAQIGIGTNSPETSSVLDVNSQTKGFLPPRMSTANRTSINGGVFAEGLIIYNTDDKCLNFYNGTDWINLCSTSTTPLPLPDFTNSTCITASDGAANDNYGVEMDYSEDGTRLIVGSYHNDTKKGSAYIYYNNGSGWNFEQQITALVGAADDEFGGSVQLSSDGATAVVGALGYNGNRGAAYIFTRTGTTWTQQQKLTPSISAVNNVFGSGISISPDGNTVLIGAFSEGSGAAYVFTRVGTTWTQKQRLTASDGAGFAHFGAYSAMSEDADIIIITASGDISSTGAAYVFTRSGSVWTEETKLTASDADVDYYFGESVGLSTDGSVAVFGASGRNAGQGAVYLFTRSGTSWTEQPILIPGDAVADDYFGAFLDITGDGTAFVAGSYNYTGMGYAYVYKNDGTSWVEHKKLSEASSTSGDLFGASITIAPNKSSVSVGSRWHNGNQGRICIYD